MAETRYQRLAREQRERQRQREVANKARYAKPPRRQSERRQAQEWGDFDAHGFGDNLGESPDY